MGLGFRYVAGITIGLVIILISICLWELGYTSAESGIFVGTFICIYSFLRGVAWKYLVF